MGHVVGGWEYIWAAYVLSWVGVAAFAWNLYSQRSKEQS